MFTPVVFIVLTYLFAFLAKKIKAIQKTILLAFMVGLHDVGKNYILAERMTYKDWPGIM